MRYATSAAFRAALEQRLLTQSRAANIPIIRLRKLVVFDRLLARLLMVAPDRWVLKGALALDYRLGARSRTTKDMDLGREDNEVEATMDLLAVQAVDLGDYFRFAIRKTSRLEGLEGVAVRFHASTELAARPFEAVTIDVGFGSHLPMAPEFLHTHDLLRFAEIEPITVPSLPLAYHVAEKVHAYVRTYSDGRTNTRVKDLVDLVIIQRSLAFEAGPLRQALRLTFGDRGTANLPARLPPPPPAWTTTYRRLALEVGIDPTIATGYETASAFLDPVLDSTAVEEARWQPGRGCWEQP